MRNWSWMNRAFMYWISEVSKEIGVEKAVELDKKVVSRLGKRMAELGIPFNETHWFQENVELEHGENNELVVTVNDCTALQWLEKNGAPNYPCLISHGAFLESYFKTAYPNKKTTIISLPCTVGCKWRIDI